MKYLLGVDFGGSSSKATLLREDGVVAATASREYPTYYPENGWAEQDAEDGRPASLPARPEGRAGYSRNMKTDREFTVVT